MNYTDKYGLKKPEETDFYSIQDQNENMDILDNLFTDIESKIGKTSNDIDDHITEELPHVFTDDGTKYRWGLSVKNGVLMMNYEEV